MQYFILWSGPYLCKLLDLYRELQTYERSFLWANITFLQKESSKFGWQINALQVWHTRLTSWMAPQNYLSADSQGGAAQPFKTWHSQFPDSLSHMCWKHHMFSISSWIFGAMKSQLFSSWSQEILFVFSAPKGVQGLATVKTCLAWSCLGWEGNSANEGNVEVEKWESWFVNLSLLPVLWFPLADFSSQEKRGQGHWRWRLGSRRRITIYLPTRLESSQCSAASDSFMLRRPWENNPEFSGVETWSHRDFLVFILHFFPESIHNHRII